MKMFFSWKSPKNRMKKLNNESKDIISPDLDCVVAEREKAKSAYENDIVNASNPVEKEFAYILSGLKCHSEVSGRDWDNTFMFHCSRREKEYILRFNECTHGWGWFLHSVPIGTRKNLKNNDTHCWNEVLHNSGWDDSISISYVEFNLNYVIPHMDDQKTINYLLANPGDEVILVLLKEASYEDGWYIAICIDSEKNYFIREKAWFCPPYGRKLGENRDIVIGQKYFSEHTIKEFISFLSSTYEKDFSHVISKLKILL